MSYISYSQHFGISFVRADDNDKKLVQGAMENFISGKLYSQDGLYEINGVKAGFDYLHSGVKEVGSLFVSCADFKAGNDVYDIDYYVKSTDGKCYHPYHLSGVDQSWALWTRIFT